MLERLKGAFKKPQSKDGFLHVQLQPCPFCGGAKLIYKHDAKQKLYYVGCTECVIFACSSSAELSVSRWNARHEGQKNG